MKCILTHNCLLSGAMRRQCLVIRLTGINKENVLLHSTVDCLMRHVTQDELRAWRPKTNLEDVDFVCI